MSLNERRRTPRAPMHSKGELRLNFVAYRGALIDISRFGALFESKLFHINVSPGEICNFELLQPNDEPIFSVGGSVVHSHRNLIGIQFEPLDIERREILRSIDTINLASPDLLNREMPALLQAWQS